MVNKLKLVLIPILLVVFLIGVSATYGCTSAAQTTSAEQKAGEQVTEKARIWGELF